MVGDLAFLSIDHILLSTFYEKTSMFEGEIFRFFYQRVTEFRY